MWSTHLPFWNENMRKLIFLLVATASLVLGKDLNFGYRFAERLSVKHPVFSDRITKGENAAEGEFPHQVSFQLKGKHICGGVIVSERTVLTAAHCLHNVENSTQYEIFAGFVNLHNPGKHLQRSTMQKSVLHPEYEGFVGPNDIAVVTLEQPFKLNRHVQKVDLPEVNEEFYGDSVLSGWGSTSRTYTPIFPETLQKAKLPIVNIQACKDYLRISPLDMEKNICTGPLNGEMAACSGDSGGPLIVHLKGKQYVIGLVSWGEIPCGLGAPTVYVKIAYYLNFIRENML